MKEFKSLTVYPEGIIKRKLIPVTINSSNEITNINKVLCQDEVYGESILNILNDGILVTNRKKASIFSNSVSSSTFYNGKLLSDLLCEDSVKDNILNKYINNLKCFYRKNFHKVFLEKKFDCSVGNLCIGDTSYFHWLFEILPGIHLMEKTRSRVDLLYSPYSLSYQKQTLDIMGYGSEKIIPAENFGIVQAQTLLVPYHRNYGYPWTKDWVLDFIRDRLLIRNSKEYPKRIYIHRNKVWKRKISNEKELINLLSRYGFVSLELENLDFIEQVNLFNRAEIIVAPHGAGLSNILFCEKGAKIIEIIGSNRVASFFINIAQKVELEYYYLEAEGVSSKEFADQLKEANVSLDDQYIQVDLEKMEKLLEISGIKI
jgi:hypothetical protein